MGIKEIKTKEDLNRELGAGGNKFILFYSVWDQFCLEFVPAFEKVSASGTGSFCRIAIDDLEEVRLIFGVETVPTVLFFREGKLDSRLDGVPDKGLTAESLAEFVWRCRRIKGEGNGPRP